jgi:hypothetical protein
MKMAALAEELTHTQADHMGVDGIYNKIQAVSSTFTRKQMMVRVCPCSYW